MPVNVGESVATTIARYSDTFADDMSNNIALYTRLKKKGRIKTHKGGLSIRKPIMYKENTNFIRFYGFDTFPTQEQDLIDAFDYDWKQAGILLPISGREERINQASDAQMLDLVEGKLEATRLTLMNKFESDLFSAGTADGGKQIGGLQLLVADTPTSGTVGAVDRATNVFARNVAYSGSTDGGAAVSATTIKKYTDAIMRLTSRGSDKTDIGFADNNYFGFWQEANESIQRILSADLAESGFTGQNHNGVDIVLAGGYGGACPANKQYLLNTNHLSIGFMNGAKMEVLGSSKREPVNQDGWAQIIGWMCNLTCDCFFVQGVLKA